MINIQYLQYQHRKEGDLYLVESVGVEVRVVDRCVPDETFMQENEAQVHYRLTSDICLFINSFY